MLDSEKQILSAYDDAQEIYPPTSLPNVFICDEQTINTQANLVYSWILLNSDPDIQDYYSIRSPLVCQEAYQQFVGDLQLFSVPLGLYDNCHAYTARGYSDELTGSPKTKLLTTGSWGSRFLDNPENHEYVMLESNRDFRCKFGFEKIYEYEKDHSARQWGDGTTLHKCGKVKSTQTPVYRVIDPHHPYIVGMYGKVKKIWVKPYPKIEGVPLPYLRFQSTRINQKYMDVACASSFRVKLLEDEFIPEGWRKKIKSLEEIIVIINGIKGALKKWPKSHDLSEYMEISDDNINEVDCEWVYDFLKSQTSEYLKAHLSVSVYCEEHNPSVIQKNLYALRRFWSNSSIECIKRRLEESSPVTTSYQLAEIKLKVIKDTVIELYQEALTEEMDLETREQYDEVSKAIFEEIKPRKSGEITSRDSNNDTAPFLHYVLTTSSNTHMRDSFGLIIIGAVASGMMDSAWPLTISVVFAALINASDFISCQQQDEDIVDSPVLQM